MSLEMEDCPSDTAAPLNPRPQQQFLLGGLQSARSHNQSVQVKCWKTHCARSLALRKEQRGWK